MSLIPAAIVDLHALLKILLAALVVGVGVTALFGQGALAAERLVAERRAGRAGAVVRDGAIVALAAAACIAALAFGVITMTHK
jgi:hypothetical protein